MVLDLDTEKSKRILASTGTTDAFDWCDFASDDRLICKYGGNVRYETVIAGFSRLVSLKTDGSDLKPLGQQESYHDAYVRQNDGEILDWLPGGDNFVLMMRDNVPEMDREPSRLTKSGRGLGVEKVDVATLRSKPVEQPRANLSHYLTDGRGEIRIMANDEQSGGSQLTGVTRFQYRQSGSKSWQSLGIFDSRDGSGVWPAAVDRERNSAYLFEKLGGRDALYRMALDGSGARTLVAKNDQVDIDSVVRLDRDQPVIGYSYADDRRHVVYFDPTFQKLAAGLAKALPSTPLIEFASASRDGKTLLVHARSDIDAGAYYLLNRDTRALRPVLLSRDLLEGRTLAPVQAITYPAADGTMIPAYLTMPKDGQAKGLPAVVLPHGGPSARDEWGFDWLAQFLAARGYAVIQPNYRGSAGYGQNFLGKNAFRDWSTAMSDIEDSAAYLAKQGIADPSRLAIVGWSYGGYAALLSASLYPSRYKAVVAIAPVTDLAKLKTDARGFTNSALTADMIGKGDNIRTGSPLANASRIKAPVLLVHGDMDSNVAIHHADNMSKALQKAGTPVEYLRFKGLEHDLDDSNARIEMLTKVGELLDRTIGR